MSKAYYHQTGKEPLLLTVAQTNPDKTVDLADAAGTVLVSQCEVLEADASPEVGSCTLAVEGQPAPKKRK